MFKTADMLNIFQKYRGDADDDRKARSRNVLISEIDPDEYGLLKLVMSLKPRTVAAPIATSE